MELVGHIRHKIVGTVIDENRSVVGICARTVVGPVDPERTIQVPCVDVLLLAIVQFLLLGLVNSEDVLIATVPNGPEVSYLLDLGIDKVERVTLATGKGAIIGNKADHLVFNHVVVVLGHEVGGNIGVVSQIIIRAQFLLGEGAFIASIFGNILGIGIIVEQVRRIGKSNLVVPVVGILSLDRVGADLVTDELKRIVINATEVQNYPVALIPALLHLIIEDALILEDILHIVRLTIGLVRTLVNRDVALVLSPQQLGAAINDSPSTDELVGDDVFGIKLTFTLNPSQGRSEDEMISLTDHITVDIAITELITRNSLHRRVVHDVVERAVVVLGPLDAGRAGARVTAIGSIPCDSTLGILLIGRYRTVDNRAIGNSLALRVNGRRQQLGSCDAIEEDILVDSCRCVG